MNPYDESSFFERAQDGMVLNQDRSRTIEHDRITLTEEEKIERKGWNAVRRSLCQTFLNMAMPPRLETVGQALNCRVLPPFMSIEEVSRSTAANEARPRHYFEHICAWDAFEVDVNEFPDPTDSYVYSMPRPLLHFIDFRIEMAIEEHEWAYLEQVIQYLDACNIHLRQRLDKDAIGAVGRVLAFTTMDASGAPSYHFIAPVDGKTTQNLLLPITATAVAEAHNDGYDTWAMEGIRNTTWRNVCQTLAQLFYEMKLNQKRFGVLTSATRTYFVRVFGPDGTEAFPRVCVSKAFLIGEKNYLRAWAYFASEAKTAAEGPLVFPSGWGLTSKRGCISWAME